MSAALKLPEPETLWPPGPGPLILPAQADGEPISPARLVETFGRYADAYDAWVVEGFTRFNRLAAAMSDVGLPVYSSEPLSKLDAELVRFREQAKRNEHFLREMQRKARKDAALLRRAADEIAARARAQSDFATKIRDRVAAMDTSHRPRDTFMGLRALDAYSEAITRIFGLTEPPAQELDMVQGELVPVIHVTVDPNHYLDADWRVAISDKAIDYVEAKEAALVGRVVIEFDHPTA
jgi:hypothetical protein